MGCVAACKFHSTPPQKCNNNTLLYLRSHPLSAIRVKPYICTIQFKQAS